MSTSRVGQTLAGRYRLQRLLGSGGMGTVYLAEHVHLGRPTAIKLLHAELCASADAGARFRREALLAARISHPTVAQIYDFECTAEGEYVIAMEYVEGETVAQRLQRAGPFPLEPAVAVLAGLAEGLDRAHALGVLHRDLKPENVMLGADGAVKLLDFGIARALDASTTGVTDSGTAVGTPAYMSPEQLLAEPLGPASDIYALGAIVYEMLTGQQPHTGATFSELRARRLLHPPTPARRLRAECPAALSSVVGRALDIVPAARWPSATAFAEAAARALHEPVGPAVVSGAAPVGASGVAASMDDQLERWEAHFEALRLAGRERERRLVRDAWAVARGGHTTLVWIEGDEGAGKSAFFALAQRLAVADGARELVGRGYEADVDRPYATWLPMLRSALSGWGRALRPWPAIEALIDGRADTPAPSATALLDEVEALLIAGAERAPLMVGIEDLDWCDPASVALFESLVYGLPDAPILMAVSAIGGGAARGPATRDVRDRIRRRERGVWLALRPLGYDAVAGWLSRALGREAPDELARFVYGHTEGNAFFIEQVVRSLVEHGTLERLGNDATSRIALASDPPPAAVADVVERRLRAMSPVTRTVLQYAAVVGREFDVELVLDLSERHEDAVLDALDEAVAAGVLTPTGGGGGGGGGDWYRFTHNKIAQVLAQGMNARRRRKLHGRIAAALEQRPDTAPAAMAWHWYHAGDTERAAATARAAARRALIVHDYDDALTFAALAAETAQSAAETREAHELRGDALWRLDRHAEAAAAYAHARLMPGAAADAALALEPALELDLRRKELRSALRAGTLGAPAVAAEARKLVDGASDMPLRSRAGAELLLAEALLEAGDGAAATEVARRARDMALRAGDGMKATEALLTYGAGVLQDGDAAAAGRAAQEAATSARELGDPQGRARAEMLRGSAAATMGDLLTARSALGDAMREAERARMSRLARQIRERLAELG